MTVNISPNYIKFPSDETNTEQHSAFPYTLVDYYEYNSSGAMAYSISISDASQYIIYGYIAENASTSQILQLYLNNDISSGHYKQTMLESGSSLASYSRSMFVIAEIPANAEIGFQIKFIKTDDFISALGQVASSDPSNSDVMLLGMYTGGNSFSAIRIESQNTVSAKLWIYKGF